MQHRRDAGVLHNKAPGQLAVAGADAAAVRHIVGLTVRGCVVVRGQAVAVVDGLGCKATDTVENSSEQVLQKQRSMLQHAAINYNVPRLGVLVYVGTSVQLRIERCVMF